MLASLCLVYVLALGNYWSIACHCAELILFDLLQRQVCLFILLNAVSLCSLCLCLILRLGLGNYWSIACHCAKLILFDLLQRQVCCFGLLLCAYLLTCLIFFGYRNVYLHLYKIHKSQEFLQTLCVSYSTDVWVCSRGGVPRDATLTLTKSNPNRTQTKCNCNRT